MLATTINRHVQAWNIVRAKRKYTRGAPRARASTSARPSPAAARRHTQRTHAEHEHAHNDDVDERGVGQGQADKELHEHTQHSTGARTSATTAAAARVPAGFRIVDASVLAPSTQTVLAPATRTASCPVAPSASRHAAERTCVANPATAQAPRLRMRMCSHTPTPSGRAPGPCAPRARHRCPTATPSRLRRWPWRARAPDFRLLCGHNSARGVKTKHAD